jgi:2-amino-4-hydroxy-6-hydroxymethyldihydropteridine diphosphokinase
MKDVYIGLGSNLDDPLSQLKRSVESIKKISGLNFIGISGFYRSAPMGPQDQPDYINAVVKIETDLPAEKVLDELQRIENEHGRVRKQHWGARTLDLDILLYGTDEINTERLTVPHSGISQRNFVLYPLNDLVNENFEIPNVGKIDNLLASCAMDGITRLDKV